MLRFASAFAFVCAVWLLPAAASAQGVQISRDVPYAEDARIPENIKRECATLGQKLSTFLAQYSEQNGVATVAVDAVDAGSEGRVLVVEITDAMSSGNAFTGHRKSMSVRGELFVDGVSQGHVDFTRNSGGGFAGGYKGSCAVLGRCTKALGKDLAGWLAEQ